MDLYQKVSPPGDPIPINVEPFDIEDLVPADAGLREVVAGLRNGRAGGSRGIKAEHIKVWLRGIREEEEEGRENAGILWHKFVILIQTIWKHVKIPVQLLWMTVVLLPKGGGFPRYRSCRALLESQ